MKAKPNANTRTLRPDKCLVVSLLFPGLRPASPRKTVANAVTTRNGLPTITKTHVTIGQQIVFLGYGTDNR
jgi:hypothetical protein